MNYIILDLEATCEENNRNFPKEIIEIGAVKIDDNKKIIDTFNVFVKPILTNKLTNFCKQLTSIKQEDIDSAEKFSVVINEFKNWIGKEDYVLCSWGFYDKNQLIQDCNLHKLNSNWVNRHISLKHQFGNIRNMKPCGMEKALNILKLPLDGTHHRGIDDAKNISKIFIHYFDKWNFN